MVSSPDFWFSRSNHLPDRNRLTLIGVVHRDPRGEQRVMSLLEQLHCDFISLEVSPYALDWRIRNGLLWAGRLAGMVRNSNDEKRRRNGHDLLNHGEIQGILQMLTIPFEVRVSQRYSSLTGARYFLLDDSNVSKRLLSLVENELLTRTNIANLCRKPDFDYPESIESYYDECSRVLATEPVPRHRLTLTDENIEINQQRDEWIEKKLRRLMADMPGHWAHICGFTHIVRTDGFMNMAARFPEAHRILAIQHSGRKHK